MHASTPNATPEEAPPPLAFQCEGGMRVDIGPLTATVLLADGRRAQLERDPGNAFHFRGEALEFRMQGTSGELVKGEGGRSPCRIG